MIAKIPATVVTGFLGSGKTTLIRHLLTHSGGRRIALIVNEFGDLGIDGETLRGCGADACRDEDIVELSNGCICCTVADDFVPTLEALLARDPRPDHIVIETSGLALPQPLIRAFAWPQIAGAVTVDGVVTVVDGRAVTDGRFAHDVGSVDAQRRADAGLDHETPLSELFEDQIACADLIVLNKTDLLSDAEAAALSRHLMSEARSGVQVVAAVQGALPAGVLLGRSAAAEEDMDARHEVHHHHDHDDDHDDDDHGHASFDSFVVTRAEVTDPAAFAARVSQVIAAHDILRLKGFVAVAGKPMRLSLQAVGPRVDTHYDRPFGDAPRVSRLVVIGQAGMDRTAIEAALAA
jgi:cobalamin biosynthesis protein CobW